MSLMSWYSLSPVGHDTPCKGHITLNFYLVILDISHPLWREEPIISFSGNFQTNNFNEIFQFLILLCSTLCIPLFVEYIECTEMAITKFLLFVLTATLGGMFFMWC
ncbi:hypothetical protein DsansV1_C17g0143881 [Dioscorea sansibarensis]